METVIRLSIALSIFLIMIGWEALRPRRKQSPDRKRRWPINIGLALFNMLLMRLTVGGAAYLSAVYAQEQSWGLLNSLDIQGWPAVAATLILLDFAIYGQHVLSHKWPLLWRLHQIHHTDMAFDATTAVRFHPLEIVFSMFYKIAWIVLLGADPLAVIAFEIILNGAATFNHGNVDIPTRVDKMLRWFIVTPDMHRIHHSTIQVETDSNYGFSISCWDRLCGTYRAEPKQAQTDMPIGLAPFRNPEELGLANLLRLPFSALRRE